MKPVNRFVYAWFLLILAAWCLLSCSPQLMKSLLNPEQKRREDYVKQHPELSPEFRNAILTAKLVMNMTPEQVVAAWGNPHHVDRSVTAGETTAYWMYGEMKDYAGTKVFSPTWTLIFTNGRLSSASE